MAPDSRKSASKAPLVAGLTGGIGSGKTTASNLFRELGVPIIDADEIAHALVVPGEPALAEIIAAFGEDIVDSSGALDRDALRTRVFANDTERQRLEAILHPRIRDRIQAEIRNITDPYCIVAIPLLLETGQTDLVDRILVIDTPEDQQISRIMARDKLDREEILDIIHAQAARDIRLAAADDIISNAGGLDELAGQIRARHAAYLEIATRLSKQ